MRIWREQRADGSHYWCGDATIDLRRYRPRGSSKKEIEDIFAALRVQARNRRYGLVNERRVITLRQLVAARKEHYDLTEKTHARNFKLLEKFRDHLGEETPVEQVTTAALASFVQSLRFRNPAIQDTTIRTYLTPVAAMLHAVDLYFQDYEGWTCPRIPYPRIREGQGERTRTISDDELTALLSALRSPRWKQESPQAAENRRTVADLFQAGLMTGFRLGELRGLKWAEIDFKAGVIKTRGLKTGRAIEASMGTALREMMLRRWQAHSCAWVFAGARGGASINMAVVHSTLKRAAKKAGVTYGQREGFTFHDTRRTAISEMMEAGIPLPAIQLRTGQTRKRVLQYAQPLRSSKKRATEILEERFGGLHDDSGDDSRERLERIG